MVHRSKTAAAVITAATAAANLVRDKAGEAPGRAYLGTAHVPLLQTVLRGTDRSSSGLGGGVGDGDVKSAKTLLGTRWFPLQRQTGGQVGQCTCDIQ